MKLIIMTQPTFFVEEDKILTALFDRGMDSLHLCKSASSPILSERLLSLIPEEYYSKITVHDHFYLKDEYKLAGIHAGDAAMSLPLGYRGRIGRTCRDLTKLKEMKRTASYVMLPGVFGATADEPAMPREQIAAAAKMGLIDRKVYAFGGVNESNIREAKELGFGAVVVREDLWERFDIRRQNDFKDLINHFEKLRKITN